jgi:hypothetical protein
MSYFALGDPLDNVSSAFGCAQKKNDASSPEGDVLRRHARRLAALSAIAGELAHVHI